MFLTPNQIQELIELIEFNYLNFSANYIGISSLSQSELDLLVKYGVDLKPLYNQTTYFDYAYRFGILSQAIGEAEAKGFTFDKLKDYIRAGKQIPLTAYEKSVLESVKTQSLKDIKGLGNRMSQDLTKILVDVDQDKRARYEKIIREEAIKTIEERRTLNDFVSRLGHKTGDWSRDFGRIADFIMHTAFDEGRAVEIEKQKGRDALVFKDVFEGACKYCVLLYTTAGVGTKPLIYKLGDLIANGNNIGRKAKDWRPVIGSTHPFCRCTLHELPDHYDWDEETHSFSKPKKWERKVQRKSKIRVKVNDIEQTI